MSGDSVIVIGVAGFGRETADVLHAIGVPVIGFVDDQPSPANLKLIADRGIPFLGSVDDWLARTREMRNYIVGIGSGRIRQLLAAKMDGAGHNAATAVHPTATMGHAVHLGAGTVICAGAQLSNAITLGRHVHVNPNATIGHDVELRDFVSINPSATISGAVEIGQRALVGAGATILQGLTVGSDATVGACALVTKDVPSSVTAVGLPATWAAKNASDTKNG